MVTALVLDALGNKLQTVLDVTIFYPAGVKTIWEFFCGDVPEVIVRIDRLPVTKDILGDYFEDAAFQSRFQAWINRTWEKKDALLTRLHQKFAPEPNRESTRQSTTDAPDLSN